MIYIASDHAGYELKSALVAFFVEEGWEYEDCGPFVFDAADDYPDFILPAAEKVVAREGARGIVIGGSGQGEAIAANKVKGVRAALYYGYDQKIITLAREHNNANVLALGARFVDIEQAKAVVKLWLQTEFPADERHLRRIDKLAAYEMRFL